MPDDLSGDVLDAERVADLQELGPERFERLVETFVRSAWGQIDEIEQMVAAADPEAVRRAAHALKGSSRIYGAVRVAAIAAVLAEEAGSAEGALGADWVVRLRDEMSAAVAALLGVVNDSGSPGRDAPGEPKG